MGLFAKFMRFLAMIASMTALIGFCRVRMSAFGHGRFHYSKVASMFKNIITYAIPGEWNPDLTLVEEALTRSKFVECGASQEKSMGWVEPRGEENGPMLESVDGQWLLKLQIETKVLPGAVVKEQSAKRIAQITEQTGRRPGKKEARDIREDMRTELLTKAFPKNRPLWRG